MESKKLYQAPITELIKIEPTQIMAGSPNADSGGEKGNNGDPMAKPVEWQDEDESVSSVSSYNAWNDEL